MKKARNICAATTIFLIFSTLCAVVSGSDFKMVCQDLDQSSGRSSSSHFSLCVSASGQASAIGSATSSNFRHFGGYIYSTHVLIGDADGDAIINITDVVYLINFIFGGGPEPNPFLAGDADCDQIVNISDAVYLINYIFSSGQPPCTRCP
ncbi:MAG: dockerin type I repeat-containing protein [bacterium]